MTKILGIDYGKVKIGLAIGDTQTRLATPIRVLKGDDTHKKIKDIKKLIEDEGIGKLVVGISEGKIADESRNFGRLMARACQIPVEFVDETLTSKDVQALSIEAGLKRKKRKSLEDAYSAALILQNYFIHDKY